VSPIRTVTYEDWGAFKRDLFLELFGDGRFRRGEYLFRGAGNADWQLVTTFDRQFGAIGMAARMRLWEELTENWRQGCVDAGVPATITDDENALWALGRHHGLPTRMLDWSMSPYVAAFFAFRSHLLADVREHRQVAIWVLHLDHPVWTGSGVDVVSASGQGNDRLRNQGGRFTSCRAAVGCLEEYVERMAAPAASDDLIALTRCLIPASEVGVALGDLDAMGITDHELFPDLTGLARLATMRAALAVTHRAPEAV
jgi:FRG domain